MSLFKSRVWNIDVLVQDPIVPSVCAPKDGTLGPHRRVEICHPLKSSVERWKRALLDEVIAFVAFSQQPRTVGFW
jgi:hypothetical protein